MYSKIIYLTLIFVFSLLPQSFSQKVEQRNLDAFTEISLKIDANIHLTQDDDQSFEIKGKSSTLGKVITEVKNRKLVIRYSAKNSWLKSWNPGIIDIYITIPQIDKLSLSGTGLIEAKDDINSRIIDLILSGSGDIKLEALKSEKVTVSLSGSGDILLKGEEDAQEFTANISGSGDIVALEMPAKDVRVKISGSGNCDVNATEDLHVRIAGSGNVNYRGNPLVDSKIAGSGKIKSINN
jgi:hypothetical protein